MSSIHSIYKC